MYLGDWAWSLPAALAAVAVALSSGEYFARWPKRVPMPKINRFSTQRFSHQGFASNKKHVLHFLSTQQ
jgi:hypothetical protein